MRSFLTGLPLLLLSIASSGQQVVNTQTVKAPQPTFYNLVNPGGSWVRAREIPLFKNREDSIACYEIQKELYTSIFRNPSEITPAVRKRRDSLNRHLMAIFATGIAGTKQVYFANPKYTSWDSVAKHKNYTEVKTLSISGMDQLPDDVLKCTNLEKLEIINASVRKLPRKLSDLSHLASVEIYNNTSKHFRLAKNVTVKRLTFQYQQPDALPRSYRKFSNLQSLFLTNNNLTQFVNGARHNKKLKHLDLSKNAITLDNHIARYKSLENLDLNFNKISEVPSSFGNLRTLVSLTFAGNSIATVSPRISSLKRLEQLSFYKNQLTHIPVGICGLTSLKELDLAYNQIEAIPDSIAALKNLYVVYFSFNKIVSVTEKIGELTNLRRMYLHDARISSLPESVGNLRKLEILRINDNYVSHLPSSFSNLVLLQDLDLARNNFHSLNIDITAFKNLALFDISENPWDNPGEIVRQTKPLADRGVIMKNFSIEEVATYHPK